MSELAERLADVIADQINPDHDGEISRENALGVAKAVIAAMREPTEEMKRAGIGRASELIEAGRGTDYIATETWSAVMAAALADC